MTDANLPLNRVWQKLNKERACLVIHFESGHDWLLVDL